MGDNILIKVTVFRVFLVVTGLLLLTILSALGGYYLSPKSYYAFEHNKPVTLTLQKLPKTYITALRAGSCATK